jgi:hypothetical protein
MRTSGTVVSTNIFGSLLEGLLQILTSVDLWLGERERIRRQRKKNEL